MRTLRFIVNGQIIEKDPTCEFSNLVPGTVGYLNAEFIFSKEWDDCVKVAAFFTQMGNECPPQILADGKTCIIPEKACANRTFKIRILGKRADGLQLKTNKVEVNQNGGK